MGLSRSKAHTAGNGPQVSGWQQNVSPYKLSEDAKSSEKTLFPYETPCVAVGSPSLKA